MSVVKEGSTPEQIDAVFRWLEFTNNSYTLSEDAKQTMENSYQIRANKGLPIGFYQYSPWADSAEKTAFEKDIVDKYANISAANVKEFNNPPEDLQLKPEEPVNCQELYAALDACIQEVITNKDADPAALLKQAAADFQRDYLDSAE